MARDTHDRTRDCAGDPFVGTLDRDNSGEVPSPAPDIANPVALSPPDPVHCAIRRTGQVPRGHLVSCQSPFDIFGSSGISS